MRDRGRLYWILLGGASFWIAPIAPIVLATVLDPALVFGHRSPYVSIISIPTAMILPTVLSLPLVGIVSFSAAIHTRIIKGTTVAYWSAEDLCWHACCSYVRAHVNAWSC